MSRDELRAGAMAIVPMLIGVIPFGLVAGVTPVTAGLGPGAAIGFSTIVFAGASQLAAIDVLGDGGTAVVAALTACTINLRMLLYSASLAPYLSRERLGRRLWVAYLMTDQAYAVSILRWADEDPATGDQGELDRRWSYYLGAGLTLWAAWQASTVAGALIGNAVPDSVPLGFAVPLVFLVLLVPTLSRLHAVVAAAVGGAATVVGLELGIGPLSVLLGALAGVAAGALVDSDDPRTRAARR
jgi:predicted branched-subunit amino acid permease